MSGQLTLKRNGIKPYFTFMLAIIISAVYVLLVIIQQLEETLKETQARADNREKPKGENSMPQVF